MVLKMIYGWLGHCKINSVKRTTANHRELKNFAKAKKTRGFSNLDIVPDEGFGQLIKQLSKE